MVAASAPATDGVNVMEFVQLAPAARGLAQVEADLANELAPGPVIVVVAVNVTAEDVLFFNVITCAAVDVPTGVEAKVTDEGVMVRPELPLAPAPVSATVCGALEAESV